MAPGSLLSDESSSKDSNIHISSNKSELPPKLSKDLNDGQLILGLLKAGAAINFDEHFDWNKAAADIGVASGSALEKRWSQLKNSNDKLQPICQIITPIVSYPS